MVYMLLGTGFEETEAIAPLDLLRRAGVEVQTVGITGKTVYGSHNIGIVADITPDEMDLNAMEMIILPGGLGGVASARASKEALDALRFGWEHNRYVAAICAGPTVLADLGITDGRNATCYPGFEGELAGATYTAAPVEKDGNIITGKGPAVVLPFAYALAEALVGEEVVAQVKAGMLYN